MNNEKYSQARLGLLVKYLREFVGERSWFDFKSNDVSPEKFGAYLAGLSNAACLANQPFGYLVFGVDDDTHEVVGTRFNPMTKKRNGELLVWWLKRNLSREVAFDMFSTSVDGKRVVLVSPVLSFEIEKEPRSETVTIPGLPGGSNWVLPERQTMFNGSDEPITEPLTGPINQDEQLLQIIANNPGRRKRELATMSGIHLANIKRLLEGPLRDRVEYRGAKRNGGYYIIDKPVNPIKAK